MRDKVFHNFFPYSHSTDFLGGSFSGFQFFWAVGYNVTGIQLFTHKKCMLLLVKIWHAAPGRTHWQMRLSCPSFPTLFSMTRNWVAPCSSSAKALLCFPIWWDCALCSALCDNTGLGLTSYWYLWDPCTA